MSTLIAGLFYEFLLLYVGLILGSLFICVGLFHEPRVCPFVSLCCSALQCVASRCSVCRSLSRAARLSKRFVRRCVMWVSFHLCMSLSWASLHVYVGLFSYM